MKALTTLAFALLLGVTTSAALAQTNPVATVEVRVWQDVYHAPSLYVSARPAGGSWRTLGTIPLPLDDGFTFSGRYRYGDFAVRPPPGMGDGTTVDVRISQAVDDTRAIHVGAREAGGSWLRLGSIDLPLDDGFSSTGRYRYGDITIDVPLADDSLLEACSNGIAVPSPASSAGLVQDCVTLLEAHDVLVGDEGTPIPNWSTDRPVTEWTGIALGGDTPRVTDITLSHVFYGRIPPGLARLDRLRTLNLWNNELTGEIPREVGLLLDLQVLDVGSFETRDSGGLTGRIPPELGDLWNLWQLQLLGNQLEGEIPREVAALPNLWSVDLRVNRLTGDIPREFGRPTLGSLSLGGNLLTGEIPVEIALAVHLQGLGLAGNLLTGLIPPELGSLSKLYSLSLSHNQLTGGIPPELGNLTELSELSVHNNQLTGEIPLEVATLPNLIRITFFNNQLTGCVPVALWDKLSEIRYDDGSRGTVQLPWCDAFEVSASLPPLDETLVAACASEGAVADPEQNRGLVNDCAALLEARDILQGDAAVLNWSADTPIRDWDYVWVSSYSERVESVWPSGKGLAGRIPAALANLTHLDQLTLSGNQLTGTIPPELAHLEHLQRLRLDDNELTGGIPPQLAVLPNLRALSLSENQLSGAIPPQLGQFEKLREVKLADNQFTGEIPWELARLGGVLLDLRGNQLAGTIPLEFAEIDWVFNLRLWLGGNDISGCLPVVLAGPLQDREELGLPYCECPVPWSRNSGNIPVLTVGADGIPYMPHEWNHGWGTYRITFQLVVDIPEGGEFILRAKYRDEDGRILVKIREEESFSYLVIDPFTGEEIERSTAEGPPGCDVTLSDQFDSIVESARVQPIDAPLSRNGLPTMRVLQPVEGPATYNIAYSAYLVVDVPDAMRLTLADWGPYICTDSDGCFSTLQLSDEESGSFLAIHPGTGEEASREITMDGGDRDVAALLDAVAASIRAEPPPYPNPSCDAAPTSADCATLLAAAATLDVDGELNWDPDVPVRRWDGVTVDPWTGRVIELDVGREGLGGEIPVVLGQLGGLEVLKLEGNQLSGGIPPELGWLSNLRELNLGTNELTGSIPAELGALTNLEHLNLFGNGLTGEIPQELGGLTRLRSFSAYGNQLEGCIPAGLERLRIANNAFNNPNLRYCTEGQ